MTRPHWQGAERDEALIKMANDGFTAAVILRHFDGCPSRSAVVGRIHRLQAKGIKVSLGQHGRNGKEKKPKKVPAPKPSTRIEASAGWRGENNVHHNDIKGRADQRAASPGLRKELVEGVPLRPELLPSTNIVPINKRLTVMQLTNETCRWPHGSPTHPDFGYCGHTVASWPYCHYHRKLAFVPAAERRRQVR